MKIKRRKMNRYTEKLVNFTGSSKLVKHPYGEWIRYEDHLDEMANNNLISLMRNKGGK